MMCLYAFARLVLRFCVASVYATDFTLLRGWVYATDFMLLRDCLFGVVRLLL